MTEREREILKRIENDPTIGQRELAEAMGLKRSSVAVHISNLMKKGIIRGRGYLIGRRTDVAVIGGANMDLVGRSTRAFLPGDSNPGSVRMSLGGVGRNIAENLALLGHSVGFVSATGEDANGDRIRRHFVDLGVRIEDCLVLEGQATSVYLAMTDDRGELVGAINDMGAIERLTPAYLESHGDTLEAADAWVIDANLPARTIDYLVGEAGDKRLYAEPVSEAKCIKLVDHLASFRMIKPNRRELGLLAGDPDLGVEEAAALLVERGVDKVLVSLGQEGALLATVAGIIKRPALPVEVVNVTGAGDAMMAAAISADLENMTDDEILQRGLQAAALALVTQETIAPTMNRRELEEKA